MAKIPLTLIVTLFTCLPFGLASARTTLHKRHHILAERALTAREPLVDAPESVAFKPRTAGGIGKRDGSAAEYTLLGCFSELSTDGTNLLNNIVPWNKTTIQSCVASCYSAASSPYAFAGILSGSQCKCDSTLPETATQVEQSNCRSQCANSDEQWCGGATSYQIYHLPFSTPTSSIADVGTVTGSIINVDPSPTSSVSPTTPSTLAVSDAISYNYVGCYEDTAEIESRVLRGPGFTSTSSTPTACATYCFGEGYPYAGIEADQCFCGATLFPTTTSDQCTQVCTGDNTLTCGAPSRISVYSISDATLLSSLQPLPTSSSGEWSSVGCFIDDTSARVMEFVVPSISEDSLSVDACTSACKGLGHTYAGLEYGAECFCSDTAPTLQADAHDCDIPCPVGGGSCGAGLRLDVYKSGI